MKILVLSDVHGRGMVAEKIIAKHPDALHVFFLGDGLSDMEDIQYFFPERTFHMVSGNCDHGSMLRSTDFVTLCGVKILFTHGHPFSVKWSLERLKERARAENAALTLYGHTHQPKSEYDDGFYFVNPGAVGSCNPSYALIDIVDCGISTNILYI